MYVLYTVDSIFVETHKDEVKQEILDIQNEKLNITIKQDFKNLLVTNIDSNHNGSINPTQPPLIDQILEDIKMGETKKPKLTPELISRLLSRHTN